MRYLFPLLLLLSACHEEDLPAPDPYDASRIEGTWHSMVPAHPPWEYCFDGQGFMTQAWDFVGVSLEYTYATRADEVHIGGDLHDPARTWKVYFVCDSIVEVLNVTPGTLLYGRFWLKKQPG